MGNVIRLLEKELAAKPALLALLPDVQIYHKAVDWPLRYHEVIDVKKARAARNIALISSTTGAGRR